MSSMTTLTDAHAAARILLADMPDYAPDALRELADLIEQYPELSPREIRLEMDARRTATIPAGTQRHYLDSFAAAHSVSVQESEAHDHAWADAETPWSGRDVHVMIRVHGPRKRRPCPHADCEGH